MNNILSEGNSSFTKNLKKYGTITMLLGASVFNGNAFANNNNVTTALNNVVVAKQSISVVDPSFYVLMQDEILKDDFAFEMANKLSIIKEIKDIKDTFNNGNMDDVYSKIDNANLPNYINKEALKGELLLLGNIKQSEKSELFILKIEKNIKMSFEKKLAEFQADPDALASAQDIGKNIEMDTSFKLVSGKPATNNEIRTGIANKNRF